MLYLSFNNSHLYTLLVRRGNLHTVPEEFDRVKRSSTYRVMCVLDGECELFLSGSIYRLNKNDICFFRPDDIYKTVPIRNMRVLNIYFTFCESDIEHLNDNEQIDHSNIVSCYTFTDVVTMNRPFVIKNCLECALLVTEFMSERLESEISQRKWQDTLLEVLILRLIDCYEKQISNKKSDKDHEVIDNMTEFIHKKIHERVSCKSVAGYLNYHQNYLNEMVKRIMGISLHRYILEQKVKYVTDELINTDKTIAHIAQDFSFYDSSHLNRCYFDVTKLRPSDIRRISRR